MASTINGFSVAYTVAGAVILWSGITSPTGSIPDTLKKILGGSVPSATEDTTATATEAGGTPAPTITAIAASSTTATANQAIAKLLAAPYGWSTGQNWNALVDLWTNESSWNNTATNPSSGAYGIAQAYGHGTSGTAGDVTNEYGPVNGMTFPDALYMAANSGDPTSQIEWGLKYIQLVYGNPVAAYETDLGGSY